MRSFEAWHKTRLRKALTARGWKRMAVTSRAYKGPARTWIKGWHCCSMRNAAIKERLITR